MDLPRKHREKPSGDSASRISQVREFIARLRCPTRVDTEFFFILEKSDMLVYLDEVCLHGDQIAGIDALTSEYTRISLREVERETVDFGFIENGVLRGATWLLGILKDVDDLSLGQDFVTPGELSIEPELYQHFLDIACHGGRAIQQLDHFSISEIHSVPFRDALVAVVDVDEFSSLGYAVANDFVAYVNAAAEKKLPISTCRSYDDLGPTHLAAQFGSEAMMRSVLSGGGEIDDVDAFGYTPLEIAVKRGNPPHIHCLLAHCANPNLGLEGAESEVEHCVALAEMSPAIYQRLRDAGTRFDVRKSYYKWTPLHYNAKRFRRDTFVAMVSDGLDPQSEDYRGKTPFDAIRNDVPEEIFAEIYRECVRR
ncbi:MAG: ankyrin repeat domain-containing protein [Planctomycetota bacterium]